MGSNASHLGVRIVRGPRLSHLLIVSLVIAIFSFAINESLGIHWWYLRSNHMYVELTLRVIAPAVAWLLLAGLGLVLHHMRGLWLLAGAPLALYWPYNFVTLFLGVGRGRR